MQLDANHLSPSYVKTVGNMPLSWLHIENCCILCSPKLSILVQKKNLKRGIHDLGNNSLRSSTTNGKNIFFHCFLCICLHACVSTFLALCCYRHSLNKRWETFKMVNRKNWEPSFLLLWDRNCHIRISEESFLRQIQKSSILNLNYLSFYDLFFKNFMKHLGWNHM